MYGVDLNAAHEPRGMDDEIVLSHVPDSRRRVNALLVALAMVVWTAPFLDGIRFDGGDISANSIELIFGAAPMAFMAFVLLRHRSWLGVRATFHDLEVRTITRTRTYTRDDVSKVAYDHQQLRLRLADGSVDKHGLSMDYRMLAELAEDLQRWADGDHFQDDVRETVQDTVKRESLRARVVGYLCRLGSRHNT